MSRVSIDGQRCDAERPALTVADLGREVCRTDADYLTLAALLARECGLPIPPIARTAGLHRQTLYRRVAAMRDRIYRAGVREARS